MSSLKEQQRRIIETMSGTDATVTRLRQEWERESRDADRICAKLGLTPEQYRTEGGSLHVPHILNHIQETLDALADASQKAASFCDKYVSAQREITKLRRGTA